MICLWVVSGCVCLRILATTDFHGSAEAFRKTVLKATQSRVDIIVVCGDVTHFGSLEEAKKLLSILSDAPCPVLFVPGNCDPPNLAEENIEGVKCIHGKCEPINTVNFVGVGGSSPTPFGTPFELSEVDLANILEQGYNSCKSGNRVILVSHDPPKDTKLDATFRGEHVGSYSVREFVKRVKPKLVLCGHIHEAVGVDKIGDAMVVNPGPVRQGQCALIDFDEKIEIDLDSL
jgi:hypothetical protein